jgi:hypothetical protein
MAEVPRVLVDEPSTGGVKHFGVARPVDLMDNTAVLPTTPQARDHHRTGQFIW